MNAVGGYLKFSLRAVRIFIYAFKNTAQFKARREYIIILGHLILLSSHKQYTPRRAQFTATNCIKLK